MRRRYVTEILSQRAVVYIVVCRRRSSWSPEDIYQPSTSVFRRKSEEHILTFHPGQARSPAMRVCVLFILFYRTRLTYEDRWRFISDTGMSPIICISIHILKSV